MNINFIRFTLISFLVWVLENGFNINSFRK